MHQLRLFESEHPLAIEAAQLYVKLLAIKLKGRLIPGYYSVDGKRYRVTSSLDKKSSWYGWSFLRTGSDYHSSKLLAKLDPEGKASGSDRGIEVLAAIMVDPIKAMQNYASITGICGVCGRKLEDPQSVALGIGPVCLNKLESW